MKKIYYIIKSWYVAKHIEIKNNGWQVYPKLPYKPAYLRFVYKEKYFTIRVAHEQIMNGFNVPNNFYEADVYECKDETFDAVNPVREVSLFVCFETKHLDLALTEAKDKALIIIAKNY